MLKVKVRVTETYSQVVEVEAPDVETAEQTVQGMWDQGKIQPAQTRDTFQGVEVAWEESQGEEENEQGGENPVTEKGQTWDR